jgi:Subtilase family/Dockerin type I domain
MFKRSFESSPRRRGDSRRTTLFRSTPRVDSLEERCLLAAPGSVAAALAPPPASNPTIGETPQYANHLSSDLADLYAATVANDVAAVPTTGFTNNVTDLFQYDAQGRVGVTVTATDVEALIPSLQADGFQVLNSLPTYHEVEGYLPVGQLMTVTNLVPQGLLGVVANYKAQTAIGTFTDQADNVMEADRVRATPAAPANITGAGVTVGVLSNSYNAQNGAAANIANGDLPAAGVHVIQDDLTAGNDDEGRAMLQLVHHVATGSPLAFATADFSQGTFASNITKLADPAQGNAKVIVDDVYYFAEPMFQDGIIAQAIDAAVTQKGVSYFSSAGNFDKQAFLTTTPSFVNTTIPGIGAGNFLAFSPGNVFSAFTLTQNTGATIELQWDSPFYTANGVATSLNFYLYDPVGHSIFFQSTTDATATQIPLQFLSFSYGGSTPINADLVVSLAKGPAPGAVKLLNYGANQFGDVTFNPAFNSPTITAHAASSNAMAVGAAPYFGQTVPESFTSLGPALIAFDAAGNRLASPVTRAKPDILSIDGTDNTVLGSDFEGNNHPNFFGTSAAAPHAAAVAALMLQANAAQTPAQLYAKMESTATPLAASPNLVGAGLVDAYRAVYNPPVAVAPDFSDGLETGAATQPWEIYKNGTGEVFTTSTNGPKTGVDHLAMDTSIDVGGVVNGFPGLDEAILHVFAANRSNVTVLYDMKTINTVGEAALAGMPSTFTGHGNFDGVSFSVDGTNWFRLANIDIAAAANHTYQSFSFNLSSIAAGLGVTLGADTRIKFQHFAPHIWSLAHEGITFDNIAAIASPIVVSVIASPSSGAFGAGASFVVSVQFSDPVTVSGGTPTLVLNSGGVATYTGGSGTKTLTFSYTTAYGQTSAHLDYISTSALVLNGASIKDVNNLVADVSLPPPGSAGSIGGSSSIVIDAVAPIVNSYEVLFGSQSFNLIGSSRIRLPWQITGIRAVFSKPIAAGGLSSLGGVSAASISGIGTNTVTWTFAPIAIGAFSTTLAGSGGSALTDALGNALAAGSGFAQSFKVLMGDVNDDGVVNASDMVLANNAIAQPYNIFFDVNGDGVIDINDYQAVRKRVGTTQP